MVNPYNFHLEATQKTPEISCDAETGTVTIIGNCVPEDAVVFFLPLKKWLESHKTWDCKKTHVTVNLHLPLQLLH